MQLPPELLRKLLADGLIFPAQPKYDQRESASPLHVFTSVGIQPPIARWTRILARGCPFFLIVDFPKMGRPLPADADKFDYLFHWLPPECLADQSPIILSMNVPLDIFALLEQSWGKDAAIGIFSRLEKGEVLNRLRAGCSTFIRPSIMGPQLAAAPPEFVKDLVLGIDAILFEQADRSWIIYSGSGFSNALDDIGFVAIDPAKRIVGANNAH